jgi:trimeric autotransporter adhesin
VPARFAALGNNTIGSDNTAIGDHALAINTTGRNNTALGSSALVNNTTGNNNTALGDSAAYNRHTGSNNIDIGNKGGSRESNTIRIGSKSVHNATSIAGLVEQQFQQG